MSAIDLSAPSREVQLEALEEYGRRIAQVESRLFLAGTAIGVIVSTAGYWGLREVQLNFLNGHIPWLTAIVGCLPPVFAMLWCSRQVTKRVVQGSRQRWLEELAEKHHVRLRLLEAVIVER